jgi:endogenous inhibitor of DNA gyrase (YacG/DUF329 family)
MLKCPICRKAFEPTASKSLPFCSERCREVDLGRWLGENYAFPSSRLREDEEEPGPDDAEDEASS